MTTILIFPGKIRPRAFEIGSLRRQNVGKRQT